ncbi:unnamed protein product [Phytophthora lilii]|uniref:Unnamed protein product n=1 Tax=Phytophthora lilii TaxID=2077276 RepID=A0A9W7D7I0_9STRA|nr:unnamed protein product [Phytophthora lilii]
MSRLVNCLQPRSLMFPTAPPVSSSLSSCWLSMIGICSSKSGRSSAWGTEMTAVSPTRCCIPTSVILEQKASCSVASWGHAKPNEVSTWSFTSEQREISNFVRRANARTLPSRSIAATRKIVHPDMSNDSRRDMQGPRKPRRVSPSTRGKPAAFNTRIRADADEVGNGAPPGIAATDEEPTSKASNAVSVSFEQKLTSSCVRVDE